MSTLPFIMPFSGGPFDHDETGRDQAALQKRIEQDDARIIVLHDGMPAIGQDGTLIRLRPNELMGKNLQDPGPLYLGLDDGAPVFAASLQYSHDVPDAQAFENMRAVAAKLGTQDLAIAGRAKSLFDWHYSHRFCSTCGTKSLAAEGGIKRVCLSCKAEHFPRVNPVVIMLVVHADQCVLGRQGSWNENIYSTLAGFVSPGETIEEACKREVWEEVGLITHDHRYIMCQPWPFPSQLMMGMICTAQDTKLTINTAEVEQAQWVSKDQVKAALKRKTDDLILPPSFTIANQLLRYWVKSEA